MFVPRYIHSADIHCDSMNYNSYNPGGFSFDGSSYSAPPPPSAPHYDPRGVTTAGPYSPYHMPPPPPPSSGMPGWPQQPAQPMAPYGGYFPAGEDRIKRLDMYFKRLSVVLCMGKILCLVSCLPKVHINPILPGGDSQDSTLRLTAPRTITHHHHLGNLAGVPTSSACPPGACVTETPSPSPTPTASCTKSPWASTGGVAWAGPRRSRTI